MICVIRQEPEGSASGSTQHRLGGAAGVSALHFRRWHVDAAWTGSLRRLAMTGVGDVAEADVLASLEV